MDGPRVSSLFVLSSLLDFLFFFFSASCLSCSHFFIFLSFVFLASSTSSSFISRYFPLYLLTGMKKREEKNMSVSPKEKGHTRRPLPPPRPQTHTPRHSSTSLKEASVTSSSPRPHAHLHAHALWHVRRGPSAYLLSVEARSGSEGREGLGRNGANVWGFLERHARGGGSWH